MKILCIKDHVRSSINDSHERIRVIINASFVIGNLRRIRRGTMGISENTVCSCVFIAYSLEALLEQPVQRDL